MFELFSTHKSKNNLVCAVGFEPTSYWLKANCSAVELRTQERQSTCVFKIRDSLKHNKESQFGANKHRIRC